MAKPKFNLTAVPSFKAKVGIPVPGKTPVDIEFIFKHRTREDFKKFADEIKEREDIEVIMDIASGWELDDPFNKENVELLLENYIGSARAIITTYFTELTDARIKN